MKIDKVEKAAILVLLTAACLFSYGFAQAQDIYNMSEGKNYIKHFEDKLKSSESTEFKLILIEGKTFELSFFGSESVEVTIGEVTMTLTDTPKSLLIKGTGEVITIKATNKGRKKAQVLIGVYM